MIVKTIGQITDYMAKEAIDALRVVLKKEEVLLKTFGLLCCTISHKGNDDEDDTLLDHISRVIEFKVPDGANQDQKLFEMCLMLQNFNDGCKTSGHNAVKFDKDEKNLKNSNP